ncbi:MAG: thiamine phosphate synthase [Chloroflexia bacterium]|nr:thiamine phosphate synthase [Chloroflexia bacterium]
MMGRPSTQYSLYLVLDPDHTASDPITIAAEALDNGVTCVQLRWKSATDRQVVDLARSIHQLTEPRHIPLIVNDRLDIALAVEAEGVHLGVDDLPLRDARRIAGESFIIGYSPEADDQIVDAEQAGASYLGIGPFSGTVTKSNAGPALRATEFARRRSLTDLPVVAIGGMTANNAAQAFAAGADGIAVASAILGASDPVEATRRLRAALPGRL